MTRSYYIVTGASSGIGYALCCHLATRNKQVLAIARSTDKLKILQQQHPQQIEILALDLAQPDNKRQLIEYVKQLGTISGLINNAATPDPTTLLAELDLASWHRQLAINLDAPIFLSKSLLPYFVKNGRIINLTTGTTNFVASGIATYAMTKAALNIFTKYLSDELSRQDILVTAAHPGIVKTAMADHVIEHAAPELNIAKAQVRYEQEGLYLDVSISAQFLTWLLLDADNSLYTGDIIGIYNKTYQPLWTTETIQSPYPNGIEAP